jgi:hypothetical protein
MKSPHDGHDESEDLGRRVLEEHKHFQLVLLDGQRWTCHLLAWGRHELLVQTETGRCLVSQHAIAYVILEEEASAVLREATAVVVATASELAEETPAEEPPPPIPS